MSNPWSIRPSVPLASVAPRVAPPDPTDFGAVVAATSPAAAPPADLAAIAVSIGLFGFATLTLLFVAWRLGWFRGHRWTFPRCPTPASAARLWIGGAAMALVFLLPGLLLASRASTATTVPAAPSARNDLASLSLMAAIYLTGFALVALVHRVLGLSESFVALGLRQPPLIAASGVTLESPSDKAGVNPELAYRHATTPSPARRISAIEFAAIGTPLAIAATMCASAITQLVWIAIGYRHESAHELLQLMQRAESMPIVLVLAIVNAVVLAPVFEELLFRGHLQTAITSLTPGRRWPAIVAASSCFALLHTTWMIPPIFVLSLVIGYLYERTGKLWVAIAAHVAFNATSTALFLVSQ